MKVIERPSLKPLNTFGVNAGAALLLEIESEEDILSLPAFDPRSDLVLGGGSNVLFVSDVPGTVFLNRLVGRQIVAEQGETAVIEVGAGENWHELVRWSLAQGLNGLENLSLIPGLAGAAPMQNIGAYGAELSGVLESVTAWDWRKGAWVVFDNEACGFGYRDSRFKSADAGRYLITSLRLRLNRQFQPQLDYAGLRTELDSMGIDAPTAMQVSDAVIRIRRRKLPDPAVDGNAGSFFKNPVVAQDEADRLRSQFPDLIAWADGVGCSKLSAAWMIEHCGWKGRRAGRAGVSERHALVIVNRDDASGAEIRRLADRIAADVRTRFGVNLEPEPQLVDFSTRNE